VEREHLNTTILQVFTKLELAPFTCWVLLSLTTGGASSSGLTCHISADKKSISVTPPGTADTRLCDGTVWCCRKGRVGSQMCKSREEVLQEVCSKTCKTHAESKPWSKTMLGVLQRTEYILLL